jgi:hypothetical protein
MTKEQLEKGKEIMVKIVDLEYEIKNINTMLQSNKKWCYLSSDKGMTNYAVKLDQQMFVRFCNEVLAKYKTEIQDLEKELNDL